MKFAFEIEGVITEFPEFFAAITTSLKLAGHEVHVVTNTDEGDREIRATELGK